MKKCVRIVSFLLGLTMLAGGTACTRKEPGETVDTEKETAEETAAETEAPLVSGREATLKTGDSVMVLEATDKGLTVRSLKSAEGREALKDESNFALPGKVKTEDGKYRAAWAFTSMTAMEGNENGTDYTGVEIRYSCEKFGLTLTVRVLARPSLAGPFEFRTSVKNLSKSDVRIVPGSFASLTAAAGGELVSIKKESGLSEGYRHYDGTFFGGTGIYRDPADGAANVTAWVNTFQNFNSSGYLPMIYQDKGDHGVYCALEWSSGRVLAKGTGKGITFSVDMDDVSEGGGEFSTLIGVGSALDFPSVYYGVYEGTLDEGSNIFKHWFFACKAPAALRDNEKEPLTQMDMQTGLSTYGIESIKWDYGWWSNEASGGWKTLEGSWELRNKSYIGVLDGYQCKTLAEFGQKAKDLGLNWTVYLLLHDTVERGKPTEKYGEFNSRTNPDWFSSRNVAGGMGNSADLGNEDCVDYLKSALTSFFRDNNIGTWRSDFEPICYTSNKLNRHDQNGTDVMYWCTVGFRDLVTTLYEDVPGFRYESCSSGGSMKDLFTATLAVSINTDDASNYMGMRATFYDSSYVIHPSQLQFPCNSDFFNPSIDTFWPKVKTTAGDAIDFKKTMLDMGYRSQCLGSPMFSSWTATCMTDYYLKYSKMYENKIRPLVRDGELYHILPRPDGVHYDGVMYSDPDAKNEIKGLIFLFKPSETPGNTCHLKAEGLDPDVTYQLTFEDRPEQNRTATGAELMSTGFDVTIEYVGSELIWFTEAK